MRLKRFENVLFLISITVIVILISGVFVIASEKYPSKPINFIVPFSAGGRTDLTARVVAQFLKTYLGQPVLIVNKPGAGGVLGAKEVARAKPDGYNIGFFSTGFITTQYTMDTPTDLKEYEPIALVNLDGAAIALSASAPYKTLKELIAFGKNNPKKIKNGIQVGGSNHVHAAAFAKAAKIEFSYIPFKGDAERNVALGGGHIDTSFSIVASLKSLAEGGKARILGVALEKRDPLFKEIPTFKEQGVDLVIGFWHGLFAPKGTPIEIIRVIESAVEKTMKDKEFISKMNNALLGIEYMNRQEFIKFLETENSAYRELIEGLGLRTAPKK